MLVLTRKSMQSIMVGDQIEITILKIERDQVKIGISAPREIPVYRKEIYEEIQKENREAATAKGQQIASISQLIKGIKKETPEE